MDTVAINAAAVVAGSDFSPVCKVGVLFPENSNELDRRFGVKYIILDHFLPLPGEVAQLTRRGTHTGEKSQVLRLKLPTNTDRLPPRSGRQLF